MIPADDRYPCQPDIFEATYQPAAERMGTDRPGVENADTGGTSAEPSDAEVQAAARAILDAQIARGGALPEAVVRWEHKADARAALAAARKVSAPPPSEPIVEAAAQAMSDSDRPAHGLTPEWDQREPEERNRYRALAHVAIRTAWQAARHE